jgi:hypothetical protein
VTAVINDQSPFGALHVHPHDQLQDCSHNHRNTRNKRLMNIRRNGYFALQPDPSKITQSDGICGN